MSVMPPKPLVGSCCKRLKHNQNRQQDRVRIFESGLVFSKIRRWVYRQDAMLGGLIWGDQTPEQWGEGARAK